MSIEWDDKEKKFLKTNAHKGINWLVDHMKRSKAGIQRIAFILGIAIKNMRNTTKAKKKPPDKPTTPTLTGDMLEQAKVRFMQENMKKMWPAK